MYGPPMRTDPYEHPDRGSLRSAWVLGLVLGLLLGLLSLLVSPFVLILAVPFVPALRRSRVIRAGVSGGLIGWGSIWLVLIEGALARCTTVTSPNSSSTCTAPDLTGWIVAAVVAVGIGLGLAVLTVSHRPDR